MVERQRTAVLDVQMQAVGRGDRTDSSGVSRRTVVVRRQEAGVLDGDDWRRGGRALNTERTALQLKSTRVEHQVSRHRDGGVVEREGARRWVVVWREVGVGWVVDQLVTVQRWVVEDDRCWLQREIEVRTPGVATAWVPVACERGIGEVVWVGLVLTGRTESTDNVVFVGRTVAVFHDNPHIGVAVGVRDVAADLEQFVHAAVKEGGGDHVVGLVHLSRRRLSVDGNVCKTAEVNHRRVAAGRRNVVSTVARVTAGV